jgi:hypothetical protein
VIGLQIPTSMRLPVDSLASKCPSSSAVIVIWPLVRSIVIAMISLRQVSRIAGPLCILSTYII